MRRRRACARRRAGAALALLALLAGACGGPTAQDYADYDRLMIESGRHRLDRDPPDAPFDDADLARNFVRIALAVERMGRQRPGPRPLRRWERPIVWALLGNGVTEADRAMVSAYMARLARLSGLDIREGSTEINLPVLVLDAEGRRREERRAREADTPMSRIIADFLARPDADIPCRGSLRHDADHEIVFASVLIQAEVSGTLRQACIEEELAQTLGLTNDDPRVRPSLFNDDQEFAVLTRHDEWLVRILYHPRLAPGMTEAEVTPLLPGILRDLRREGGAG